MDAPAGGKLEDRLTRICAASRVRSRRVILRGDWWTRDNGPLVAFRALDPEQKVKRPVALLPLSTRSYELVDPADGSRARVDAAVAETLSGDAHMFYPPLPERPVTKMDLLRSALAGRRRDLLTILLMGAGGGLLGMLVPILTGQIFGSVIPGAERGQLLQIILAGQPELNDKLALPALRQLRQRVALRCTIPPLDEEETREFMAAL